MGHSSMGRIVVIGEVFIIVVIVAVVWGLFSASRKDRGEVVLIVN